MFPSEFRGVKNPVDKSILNKDHVNYEVYAKDNLLMDFMGVLHPARSSSVYFVII